MSAAHRTVERTTPLVVMPNNINEVTFLVRSPASSSVVEKAPTRRFVTTISSGRGEAPVCMQITTPNSF